MLASGRCGQDARSGRSVGAMSEPKAPRAAWREDRPVAAEAVPPFTGSSAKKYSAAGLILSLFLQTKITKMLNRLALSHQTGVFGVITVNYQAITRPL